MTEIRKSNGKIYREEDPRSFDELRELIAILRDKDEGCPWDSVQTPESLKECLLNETNEVLAAIDAKDTENLQEELGDVLLQILLLSQIAGEKGWFTFDDVIQTLSQKLVRRHPYVFTDQKVSSPEEGAAMWNEIKRREKERKAARKKALHQTENG